MKIFIGTLNGGGKETLIRLYKSIEKNLIPQLKDHDWKWVVAGQGKKGISVHDANILIKQNLKNNFNFINYSDNIGVVFGTNELIDYSKSFNPDIFWMIDDDIVINSNNFIQLMINSLKNGNATCATQVCFFGKERSQFSKTPGKIINVGDHGSGCTMYKKEVYEKCGYYDEDIIQYASDSEFNNRIKLIFGENSLSILCGKDYTKHYNQTGTNNCYNKEEWSSIIKHDSKYFENKKYTDNNIYEKRKHTKSPIINNGLHVITI